MRQTPARFLMLTINLLGRRLRDCGKRSGVSWHYRRYRRRAVGPGRVVGRVRSIPRLCVCRGNRMHRVAAAHAGVLVVVAFGMVMMVP